jgi:hypothetical protein
VIPLFHPLTKQAVDDFIASPAHALLLSGPTGAGKATVADYIVSQLLNIAPDSLNDNPYILRITSAEKNISIDSIRNAQSFLHLKTPGNRVFRRAIIIEGSDAMSTEAQNAFLKILEEPPDDTILIITASAAENLLPTIQSRTQHVRVLPIDLAQLTERYHSYPASAVQKAYFISEGYIGLLHAMLEHDNDHPLVVQIAQAKQLLSATTYERLIQVERINKDKNIELLLHALERVCHASLTQAIRTNSSSAKKWAHRLKIIIDAEQILRHNAQSKLLLTQVMINL